jgi:hypothetical protein
MEFVESQTMDTHYRAFRGKDNVKWDMVRLLRLKKKWGHCSAWLEDSNEFVSWQNVPIQPLNGKTGQTVNGTIAVLLH